MDLIHSCFNYQTHSCCLVNLTGYNGLANPKLLTNDSLLLQIWLHWWVYWFADPFSLWFILLNLPLRSFPAVIRWDKSDLSPLKAVFLLPARLRRILQCGGEQWYVIFRTRLLYLHHFLSVSFLLQLLAGSVCCLQPLLLPHWHTGTHLFPSYTAILQTKTHQIIILFSHFTSIFAFSTEFLFHFDFCPYMRTMGCDSYRHHTTPSSLVGGGWGWGGGAVNHNGRWVFKGVAQKVFP